MEKCWRSLKDPERCTRIAKQIVRKGLSVRQAEVLAKKDRPPVATQAQDPQGVSDKFAPLKQALEQRTGLHFVFQGKVEGPGQVAIKFQDRAEFDRVFDYLMK